MKRVSIYFIIGVLFLVLSLQAQEQKQEQKQENPFDSFMGIKWGTDALQFKTNFQYKDKLKSYKSGFYIMNFNLGDVVIENIMFIFAPDQKALKSPKPPEFKKEFYALFKFEEVILKIKPEQFEAIFDIFKVKYGDPLKIEDSEIQNRMGAKFTQKIAKWTNEGRNIFLFRYTENINEGTAYFSAVKENDAKEKEAKDKAAADKL